MARSKRNNTNLALTVGRAIRKQRKTAGMTQAALAEAIGMESETVSRMENGVRLPSIEKLVEIAGVFDVAVATFFEAETPSKASDEANELAEKISLAIEKLPETGKAFVLEVAQNYAQYHAPLTQEGRKKSTKNSAASNLKSRRDSSAK